MEVHREDHEQETRLRINGSLTLETAPVLQAELMSALKDDKQISVDLCGIEACDTYGVQLLIAACRTKTGSDLPIILANMPPDMRAYYGRIGFETEA